MPLADHGGACGIALGLCAGVLLLVRAAAAGGAAPSPLALSCLGCHQPAVNSPEMPALQTLSGRRIDAALRSARDAPRTGSIMARFASGLSDADIARLARELGRAP
jgi:cytochrome c553